MNDFNPNRSLMSLSLPRCVLSAVFALSSLACADPVRPSVESAAAHLVISASVVGTPVATLVATVTAPDIPVPLVKNLVIRDGIASGTLTMPAGAARTIAVQAFDDDGQISHEGHRTIDVRHGLNPGIAIPMFLRAGDVPITVQIGSVAIALSQTSGSLSVGSAVHLAATIETADGEEIPEGVQWATSNPTIVSVSSNGLVTALGPGTAHVVATFAGVAAVATIEVTAGDQS